MKNAAGKFMLRALTLSTFVLVVSVLSTRTYAAENQVCNPAQSWFEKIQSSFGADIRRTTMDNLTSGVSDFAFHAATGSEISEVMNCMGYVGKVNPSVLSSELKSYACDKTPEEVCKGLINQFAFNDASERQKFASSQTAGSLLGLAHMTNNYLQYEPVPVNMAYFFSDYGRRLPVIGDKVFAAGTVDYQHTLINSMLDGWKIMRNIAYGLMSMIMLWVGIAIITRQKISQQVVVNVQYALPKIVVALILIAFSYPIGATITSLSWSLWNSVPDIVTALGGPTGGLNGSVLGTSGGAIALIILIGSLLATSGIGVAVGILAAIFAVVFVIMYLMPLIKALFIYFKMLGSIIFAPVQFAFAAIPGNDAKIVDWFKQMAVWGLSLVAMRFVLHFTLLLGTTLIAGTVGQSDVFSGSFYLIFGTPLLFLFGFGLAFKTPDMIQNALMGPPPKRK